jgi:DNA-binding transcriptional MerR regulator
MSDSTSDSKTWAIGELASEFEVTSRALRLYEEEGLLEPRRAGTRRIFSEGDRVRLRLVLRGKRLGWSLAEIKELFDLYDSSHGEEAQLELMLAKLEQRREILRTQKRDVENALEDLERILGNAKNALDEIRTG